jgi:hypothetical protein
MWVRENTTKALAPTGVFRTPSRRTGGAAYTVCYMPLVVCSIIFSHINTKNIIDSYYESFCMGENKILQSSSKTLL